MVQAAASDSTGKAHSITTWVVLFLKSVLAVAVVGLLLAKTGASAVFDTLRLVPLSAALLACMLTMLQPLLGALRWHLIMRFLGGALTIAQTVRAFCWALSRQPCCRRGHWRWRAHVDPVASRPEAVQVRQLLGSRRLPCAMVRGPADRRYGTRGSACNVGSRSRPLAARARRARRRSLPCATHSRSSCCSAHCTWKLALRM